MHSKELLLDYFKNSKPILKRRIITLPHSKTSMIIRTKSIDQNTTTSISTTRTIPTRSRSKHKVRWGELFDVNSLPFSTFRTVKIRLHTVTQRSSLLITALNFTLGLKLQSTLLWKYITNVKSMKTLEKEKRMTFSSALNKELQLTVHLNPKSLYNSWLDTWLLIVSSHIKNSHFVGYKCRVTPAIGETPAGKIEMRNELWDIFQAGRCCQGSLNIWTWTWLCL